MRKTKTAATVLLLAFFALPSVSALDFDFGGTVYNSTAFEQVDQDTDPALDELAILALWFDMGNGVAGGNNWSLSGQVHYEFTDERPWLVDLDYLKFFTRIVPAAENGAVLDFSAGRYMFSDPSAYVLSHASDGLSLRMLWPKMRLSFSAGYTGLLLNPSSDIRMTSNDWADEQNETDYFFGPRRLFVLAELQLPDVGKINELNFFAAGQFDMALESDRTILHTQYLGLVSNRRYGKNLYETFNVILEAGELTEPDADTRFTVGLLVGWNWRYLREDWSNSRFSLRLLAAPPDFATDLIPGVGVGLLGFVPMNQPELGVTVSPHLAGLGFLELGYSFMPFGGNGPASRLQPYINGRGYFRTFPMTVGWIDTDPDSDSVYLGTELEGGVKWRLFSDVGLGLTGAVFMPAVAPFGGAADNSDTLWSVRLDVSFSF